MMNEIKDINEVIIRFLDGTATGEEKVFLFNWLKQSEKNRNEFSEVRDLWLLGNTIATDDLETEIALERFKNRIQSTESGLRKSRFVFPEHFSLFLRVAAVFLILFAVGSASYYWGSSSVPGQKEVMNRLLTANGSKGRFVLPDSTVVWLNSNSLLEYPETFSASAREVSLSGEAYFEVRRNEKLPFIVDNYQRKSGVEAVLVEGSVKIAGCKMNHSVVLTPGQLINYDKKSERTKVQMVNTDDYISWIQNELTFDNDKLADIIINLNKWYGVDIECPSEFAEKVFMSFSVRNGENLDEILKAMTLVAPIRYYWENGILHILPRKR